MRDICQVTAYFNYVNRIADGLGVHLEERFGRVEMDAVSPDEA